MNRKQRRAARRSGAQSAPAPVASRTPADTLAGLFGAAMTRHRAGALIEAEQLYRQILELFPDHAETHGMLAVALITQGKTAEALVHFQRAAALKPDVPGVYDDLGKASMAAGRPEVAIDAAGRALELGETEQRKSFFAQCIRSVVFKTDDGRFRRLALRALVEAWARPRELARVCINLIRLDRAVNDAIARAETAWPARLPVAELFGSLGMAALSRDEFLCRLLEIDPIADLGFERLLTNVRSAMLTRAAEGAADEDHLAFYCALARQCFVNEYVFSTTEAEDEQARKLRTALEQALAAKTECPALWPVAVGAYFPLHTLSGAEALFDRPWPDCVKAVLVQQIREPAMERQIATTIPALTIIDGEVSRMVRQQYEENPYPRWVKAGPPGQPPALSDRLPGRSFDVLIAGCGTGLSTTEFARQARNARILAIDLSLASLSYAKRMAQNFALTNIEFAQADITRLASIGRQFDFIDASGVLHHLGDPWEGWRILLSLLRPGGVMEVGLYSELARRNVLEARALIAERGYRPIAEDIRRCRDEIAAAEDGSPLKTLTLMGDFFTTGECRDLLFHPQEHRLTLSDIKAFLAANNLEFGGFVLPPAVMQQFARRFPERTANVNLDCWHAFETEAPDTFAGMYLFSVRKPGARPQTATPH